MADVYRNWTFIIYPDSMPDDAFYQLANLHIPCIISPLHSPSEDPRDKEEYKMHYHVMLMYSGNKSYKQVERISKDLLNGTAPQVVEHLGGMARYFCHLDNPEKGLLDVSKVMCLSGASYQDCLDEAADFERVIQAIQIYIENHDVRYFYDLSFMATHVMKEWRRAINGQAVYWKHYLTSRSDKLSKGVVNEYNDLVEAILNDH